MGREAVAVCHWNGQIAELRLHLDSGFLNLRGDIRADLPRADITGVTLVDDGVLVRLALQTLHMEFDEVSARQWHKALLKTPPTLAEKFGVGPDARCFVQGAPNDRALSDALVGAMTRHLADASILLAIIENLDDLDAATTLAQENPTLHLWAVYPKGKGVAVGATAIRTHLRGLGFIDSKSCAVSDRLTATRYRLRRT
ncbi:hypothetical protein [Yoonia sp. SS1-5]|uniref:Uncharacterized protein n=1 Tax=Yoonia rhodophyticola TaxID=3137370 RepID=A0AAN0NKG8_9RHOB